MSEPNDLSDLKQAGDVGAMRVAKVYAEALFAAAEQAGQPEEILQELESLVHDVLDADPRLDVLFSNAALGRETRADVIAKAFHDRVSPTLYGFIQVLNRHDRLELLRPVSAVMRSLFEAKARRVRTYVTSAAALTADEQNKVVEVIRKTLKLEPILVPIIDPSVLGGVKIRVGDRQYDATVRSRLETIRNQLLASSSHEIQSGRDRFSSSNGN